ncbi:MAG TPA: hypothetical protein VLL52_08335, partial [Anaerolineae bacterium]|nr:hypothetical protein [Anaerolineae bacterium]
QTPTSTTPYESIIPFTLGEGWAGNTRTWGGNTRTWGGNTRTWGGNTRTWGAPVMSDNGQVQIFNLDDILGDTGTASFQALPDLATLPNWFTPVGQAYRFTAISGQETTITRTIAFNYLQTNVPGGNVYENLLTIYHSPDNGLSWQRLNTTLDTQENFAAAQMRGNGLYTLLSTIAYDPFTTGWNNFGYGIPETRPITTGLASLTNQYGSIHHYSANNNLWSLHDPLVTTNYPLFDTLINNLVEFNYTQAYWITVTQPITLFMAPPDDTPTNLHNIKQISTFQLPPATYFGWLTPTTNTFTPTIGMPITAWIDGTLCGSTNIISWQGKLAYKLQVKSETLLGAPNNCGQLGKTITFQVDNWIMDHDRLWANDYAWYHPLTTILACAIPEPVSTFTLAPSNNDLTLSWNDTEADTYAVWHDINTPYFLPLGDCTANANCSLISATNYTEVNALTTPSNNYTFLIIAQNNCGTTASQSIRRGAFQFVLTSGS